MVEAVTPPHNVSFPSNGRTAQGFLALPSGTTLRQQGDAPGAGGAPAVVVIQEWWGLTEHIVDVAGRFADEGFVALAPDLFGGRTTHDRAEAARMRRALPVERAATDLEGAVRFLLRHEAVVGSSVGVVGFCMGGAFALVLAAAQGVSVGAAVAFYGLPDPNNIDFSGLTAPVLGHYGDHDRSITPDVTETFVRKVDSQAGIVPVIHTYPAGHGFFNDRMPGSYHQDSAVAAWDRTVEFLREHVH